MAAGVNHVQEIKTDNPEKEIKRTLIHVPAGELDHLVHDLETEKEDVLELPLRFVRQHVLNSSEKRRKAKVRVEVQVKRYLGVVRSKMVM